MNWYKTLINKLSKELKQKMENIKNKEVEIFKKNKIKKNRF